MRLKYLKRRELEYLPPITRDDALQIKKRNKALLKAALAIRNNWKDAKDEENMGEFDYSGEVGCPHCIKARKNCDLCSWPDAPEYGQTCCGAEFGEISLNRVSSGKVALCYGTYSESIEVNDDEYCDWQSWKSGRKQLTDIITFLRAHIEWADLKIKGEL